MSQSRRPTSEGRVLEMAQVVICSIERSFEDGEFQKHGAWRSHPYSRFLAA